MKWLLNYTILSLSVVGGYILHDDVNSGLFLCGAAGVFLGLKEVTKL